MGRPELSPWVEKGRSVRCRGRGEGRKPPALAGLAPASPAALAAPTSLLALALWEAGRPEGKRQGRDVASGPASLWERGSLGVSASPLFQGGQGGRRGRVPLPPPGIPEAAWPPPVLPPLRGHGASGRHDLL